MRLLVRSTVAVCVAALVLACSDSSTESQTVASRLRGTWVEPIAIAGSALEFSLATQNTNVSGTGTYSREAAGSGTVTVAGAVSGATVDFDITFDDGQVRHFRGKLANPASLNGIWYAVPAGDPSDVVFDRVQ